VTNLLIYNVRLTFYDSFRICAVGAAPLILYFKLCPTMHEIITLNINPPNNTTWSLLLLFLIRLAGLRSTVSNVCIVNRMGCKCCKKRDDEDDFIKQSPLICEDLEKPTESGFSSSPAKPRQAPKKVKSSHPGRSPGELELSPSQSRQDT
jgi:hypothetical protein